MSGDAPPASLRGIAVGQTGSGKTWWMWRHVLSHARRLLVCEQTGEWQRLAPHARFAYGYDDTVAALRASASRPHWCIVATLTQDEIFDLVDVLIPVPNISDSPAAHMGGMTLFLDEVDLVIPQGAPEPGPSIYRRSRHAGLSVMSATQIISNVNKQITSQSDFIAVLSINEPNCVDYLESRMGRETWDEAAQWIAQPYHVALFLPKEPPGRRLQLLAPERT